jgi:hypothetical protein
MNVTTNALGMDQGGATAVDFFKGVMDEVAVYNKALTATQVQSHYTTEHDV